jgi:hypothetical protein
MFIALHLALIQPSRHTGVLRGAVSSFFHEWLANSIFGYGKIPGTDLAA